jgi:diguanylate cyclase (GGDEF)-like protein
LLRVFDTSTAETARPGIMAPLALIALAAVLLCGALGAFLAGRADEHMVAAQHQALRSSVEAVQSVAPDLRMMEPRLVRILEQASGVKALRFDVDPPDGSGEKQSLLDSNGRIIGWLSWESGHPGTAMLLTLAPFAALMGAGLLAFAALALWQVRVLGMRLAKSEQTAQKLRENESGGLPNQAALLDRLGAALAPREQPQSLALALIELDNFAELTDRGGEGAGETVTAEIVERLRDALPADGMLARLRSDRFAMLLLDATPDTARLVALAAHDAVARTVWIDDIAQITASTGFALAPQDATTCADLMQRAKLALCEARRRGHGSVVAFEPAFEQDLAEQRFIRRELAIGLAAGVLDVHYQPIVTAEASAVVGVEALLRWKHPTRGMIPPALVIPAAEDTGLMHPLGEFVLRRALTDAARWPQHITVAINLSPLQLRDNSFSDLLTTALRETRIAPSRVVLEITEGALMDDPETMQIRLQDLHRLGVRLALDDFGAGYSSLAALQRLPFDKLKVDRRFVAALDRSANAGVIIQAIIALGRALGVGVLIEGVETDEQRVLLRLAGCNEMQGFLFARPSPREEIDRLFGLETAPAGLLQETAPA